MALFENNLRDIDRRGPIELPGTIPFAEKEATGATTLPPFTRELEKDSCWETGASAYPRPRPQN